MFILLAFDSLFLGWEKSSESDTKELALLSGHTGINLPSVI